VAASHSEAVASFHQAVVDGAITQPPLADDSLAAGPEFRLCHPRFSELYRSIGTVFREHERPDLMKCFRNSEPDASAMHAATSSIATSILRSIKPDFVVELAVATTALKSAPEAADVHAATVEAPVQDGRVRLDDVLAEADKTWKNARRCDGLLLSFGLIDHLSEAQMRELLAWIRNHDLLAAFGFTPPGETGVAGRNSRSFRHLFRLVTDVGLTVATPRASIWIRSNSTLRPAGMTGSRTHFVCIHTALVGSKKQIAKAGQKSETSILTLSEIGAEAFEQENLLRLHYSCGFEWRRLPDRRNSLVRSPDTNPPLTNGSKSRRNFGVRSPISKLLLITPETAGDPSQHAADAD
jgi:hypothetical protein